MRPTALPRLLPVIALLLGGCASAGGGEAGVRPGPRDRILTEELANLQQLSALEVVQRLRPTWLRIRSGSLPEVVLDGTPIEGGARALQNIRVGEIRELQYLNPSDATMRFGTGYLAGAILVFTGR